MPSMVYALVDNRFKYVIIGDTLHTKDLLTKALGVDEDEWKFVLKSEILGFRICGFKVYSLVVEPLTDYLWFCNYSGQTPEKKYKSNSDPSLQINDRLVYHGNFLLTHYDLFSKNNDSEEVRLVWLSAMIKTCYANVGEYGGIDEPVVNFDLNILKEVNASYNGLTIPIREYILDTLSPDICVWNTLKNRGLGI